MVTWPMTYPRRCCEAVRSAILATAWLLVLNTKLRYEMRAASSPDAKAGALNKSLNISWVSRLAWLAGGGWTELNWYRKIVQCYKPTTTNAGAATYAAGFVFIRRPDDADCLARAKKLTASSSIGRRCIFSCNGIKYALTLLKPPVNLTYERFLHKHACKLTDVGLLELAFCVFTISICESRAVLSAIYICC